MKVDLTKYIEQHSFTFDDVFDSDETNEKVCVLLLHLAYLMIHTQATDLL